MRTPNQQTAKTALLNQSNGQINCNTSDEWLSKKCDLHKQAGKEVETEKIIKSKNLLSVKTKLLMLRGIAMMLLLLAGAGRLWAQGPYPNQGPQSVCIGDVTPYGVISTPGSTYAWSIIPVSGGNGIIIPGNSNLTSVTWNSAGTTNLQVIETNSEGCLGTPVQILITVIPANTITLSSAVGTNGQTVCINTPITNITYATTGANGATFAGLPAGVTGNFAANSVTINGTPTASGPFNYTVTLTGGCGTVTANGTISVTPAKTITLSSSVGTNAQTVCINSAITNITYATTGATGATFAGLPAGVTGGFAGNTVTISGTPTVSGPFNYTVTLSGGCGTVTATGSITVNPLPVPTITPTVNPVCFGTTGVVYTTEPGMTNYIWVVTGGLQTAGGTPNDNTVTVTWNGTGPYSVSVNYRNANGCSATSPTILNVTVTPLPVTSPIYHD